MPDSIWNALLALTNAIKKYTIPIHYCYLQMGNEPKVFINQMPSVQAENQAVVIVVSEALDTSFFKKNIPIFKLRGKSQAKLEQSQLVDHPSILFKNLAIYLPYCFLSYLARQAGRAMAVSHFAQTLDAKIATHTGDSKWIGNPENLIHAHRMRALCDAILIGKQTLQADQPSLTVRHVKGSNPQKVVIASSTADYSSLLHNEQEEVLVLSHQPQTSSPQINCVHLSTANSNGHIHGLDILKCLYDQGYHSVYIEGGAVTTSNFLKDRAIDIVQLHYSPQIFGSGISAIQLPQIDEVGQAIRFEQSVFYMVGDGCMFVGEM